jgi:ParB family chromosome partitioning protein
MSKKADAAQSAAFARTKKRPEVTEVAEEMFGLVPAVLPSEQTVRIPIDQIKRSAYQVRHFDENVIEDLMESISDTNGLISPVIVRPLNNGFELIAGHTRTEACKRLGYSEIIAVVRNMTDQEAAKALAADNVTRKDLTDFELFKQIAMLFANGFLKSNSEASRLLGKARQDIIRYQAFGKLPQAVIELLDKQPDLIGASVAKDLADLVEQGHSSLVSEACEKLFDRHIKNQNAIILWIHQRLAERPTKQEYRVVDANGRVAGRVVLTNNGLKITGKRLDFNKINDALKTSLPDMILKA